MEFGKRKPRLAILLAVLAIVAALPLLAISNQAYADSNAGSKLTVNARYDDNGTDAVLFKPAWTDKVYFGIQVKLSNVPEDNRGNISSNGYFTIASESDDRSVETLFNAKQNGSLADAFSPEGEADFILWIEEGGSAEISGLPDGAAYSLSEKNFTSQTFAQFPSRVFDISYTNDSGSISGNSSATVVNTQKTIDFVFKKTVTDGYCNPDDVFFYLWKTWPNHTYTYESFTVKYPDHSGAIRTAKTVSSSNQDDYCVLLPIKDGEEIHVTVPTWAWFDLSGEYLLKSKYIGTISEADVLDAYEKTSSYSIGNDIDYLCLANSDGSARTVYGDDYGTYYWSSYPDIGTSALVEDMEVAYENVRPTQPIQVSKSVQAGFGDITSTFRLKLWDGDEDGGTPIEGFTIPGTNYTTDENGEVEFEIVTHGTASASLTLDIPANCYYSIEEVGCSDENCEFISINRTQGLTEYTHRVTPSERPINFLNQQKLPVPVRKINQDEESVKGAVLQILDEKGEVVYEWTTNGGAETVYLQPNTLGPFGASSYTLHEKQTPAGYDSAEDIMFYLWPHMKDGSYGEALIQPSGSAPVDELVLIDEEQPREIKVQKVWDDEDNAAGARPQEVNVQLQADGENIGNPITLNAENEWSHTWTDLDWYSKGEEITYTVEETSVPEGYTCKVAGDAENGFTVTNSYAEPSDGGNVEEDDEQTPEKDTSKPNATPQTGDETLLGFWIVLLLLAGSGLIAATLRKGPYRP